MKSKYFAVTMLLILAAAGATLAAWPHLPSMVATHWDIHNNPNGYSPKWVLLILGPGLMIAIMVLMYFLPWLSPKRFEVDTFRSTYLYLMVLIVAMQGYCYAIILWASMGRQVDVGRAIVGGICLLFALMGNVMGKVRRNFFVGVRTPWALANERVWNATHRLAAKMFVLCGLAGLALTALGMSGWPIIVCLMTGALIPVVYSLVFYKHLERSGEV